jgi:hypothetical protein
LLLLLLRLKELPRQLPDRRLRELLLPLLRLQ